MGVRNCNAYECDFLYDEAEIFRGVELPVRREIKKPYCTRGCCVVVLGERCKFGLDPLLEDSFSLLKSLTPESEERLSKSEEWAMEHEN